MAAEHERLAADKAQKTHWRRWGPYVSDRQWGTVREDYSPDGREWNHFPHEQARSRAYRWGEDGLFGISDDHQRLCFALALWNGKDFILKERLFGLEGNVKETYFYIDNTPTHSYMKALYKYPQAKFPYDLLIKENKKHGKNSSEFGLADTGVFEGDRYFDVEMEYAKNTPEDILIQITAFNRGPEAAPLDILPTLWFRNTWVWGRHDFIPLIQSDQLEESTVIRAEHRDLGTRWLYVEDGAELLFTENESNLELLFKTENKSPFVKDAFHRYIVNKEEEAVNEEWSGTKAAARFKCLIPSGGKKIVRLRLTDAPITGVALGPDFDAILATRRKEADEFYAAPRPYPTTADRHALAGLLWSKQYYNYAVPEWLEGDPAGPKPPDERLSGRNSAWKHLRFEDILLVPEKWKCPWFSASDLAYQCVSLALIDPEFAKHQLDVLTREWGMHPNGQLPSNESDFGNVQPPVHAWAAWNVYTIEKENTRKGDRVFLERVFHKLLLNFTWWMNRGVERSEETHWMAAYNHNMLSIATELARENVVYEDMAAKFSKHILLFQRAGKPSLQTSSLSGK